MLDDARVQQGRLAIQRERGDVVQVVTAAVEEQRQLAGDRIIELELSTTQPVEMLLDADRIGQVVANYLTNALKYSPADTSVVVHLQVEGTWARVSVRDRGVGVPPETQAHIWERFYRDEGVKVQSG
jgi:signal transduction histidine kinase